MNLIGFGTSSTLLKFQDKYYKYSTEGLKKKGFAIGGFESYFLADLVEYYLFEVTNKKFKDVPWREIYRESEFLLFKGGN